MPSLSFSTKQSLDPDENETFLATSDRHDKTNEQVDEHSKEKPGAFHTCDGSHLVVFDKGVFELTKRSRVWLDEASAHEFERFFEQDCIVGLFSELVVRTCHQTHCLHLGFSLAVPLFGLSVVDDDILLSQDEAVWIGDFRGTSLHSINVADEARLDAKRAQWWRLGLAEQLSVVDLAAADLMSWHSSH